MKNREASLYKRFLHLEHFFRTNRIGCGSEGQNRFFRCFTGPCRELRQPVSGKIRLQIDRLPNV